MQNDELLKILKDAHPYIHNEAARKGIGYAIMEIENQNIHLRANPMNKDELFDQYYLSRYDNIDSEFAVNIFHSWKAATAARDAEILAMLDSQEIANAARDALDKYGTMASVIAAIKKHITGDK